MLTDAQIRRQKPPAAGILKLWDGDGLYLAVTHKDSRLWRMRFKRAGKEQVLSFGPYPTVTLADARGLRDAAQASLRAGVVPAGRRRAAQSDAAEIAAAGGSRPTFEDVARAWHKQQLPRWDKRHAENVLISLERDVFPNFGADDIAAITSPQVLAVVRAIEARSVEFARRVRQRISAVFCHAIAEGTAAADPSAPIVRALAPYVKGQRKAIIDLVPARAVLEAVEAIPAFPITKLAHRLLALTAVRPGELRAAMWAEFEDLNGDAALWRIPAARMKMKREHLVPLAPAALDVLAVLRPLSGDLPILFPSTQNPRKPISENAIGYMLNRAGFRDTHQPHGWRATFSSVMNEQNRADRAVIELMLAHAPADRVEAAYHRSLHMERRREIAVEWALLIGKNMMPAADLLDGARR